MSAIEWLSSPRRLSLSAIGLRCRLGAWGLDKMAVQLRLACWAVQLDTSHTLVEDGSIIVERGAYRFADMYARARLLS